jgi:hypothetical protein
LRVLTAAKILGEIARIDRFSSKDACDRHNGSAPLPVWSSTRPGTVYRGRLGSRTPAIVRLGTGTASKLALRVKGNMSR